MHVLRALDEGDEEAERVLLDSTVGLDDGRLAHLWTCTTVSVETIFLKEIYRYGERERENMRGVSRRRKVPPAAT